MPDVLFIKTSSLGDVIHHMPAVIDARKARPETAFAWLVEEAFAPLVRLHPAVSHVIPVAWRRWRKSLYAPSTMSEIAASLRTIRDGHFDDIVDTQGLLRSALIARAARGRRHGYDSSSIREPLASAFYDVRYRVSRDLHAVERNRALSGLALGYSPQGAPDFGLDRARFSGQAHVMDCCFTPPLGRRNFGLRSIGSPSGKSSTEISSCDCRGAPIWSAHAASASPLRFPVRASKSARPLDQVAALIAGAQFVVGVDTGLLHLAAALGVPLVAIFTGSRPGLTGPVGSGPIAILGTDGAPPAVDAVIEAVATVVR